MPKVRMERRNEEIRKMFSTVIFDMKDPRVSPMTTVVSAEVTPDLKYCKARISVYDQDEQARAETVDALNRAEGHIAHEVGQRMRIRCIPQFKFILDDSIAYSVHISDILNKLNGEASKE